MRLADIKFEQGKTIYGPREDSWLLAKAIHDHASLVQGKKCLDMGSGSGIQTAALLLENPAHVESTDIDPHALEATRKMVAQYFPAAPHALIQGDLFSHVKGTFDLIVFNPPYVPSDEIKWRDTDGGKHGREIIDLFLKRLPKFLKPNGKCLLLESSLNVNEKTEAALLKIGLRGKIVSEQKLFMETLFVRLIERD